jgi:nucleotide-binding universal stress UspA family protein
MKNIAVATDFSEGSINAVNYAASLAADVNAKLHIIHVYETPVFFTSEMPYTAVEAAEKMASEEANRSMKAVADDIQKDHSTLKFDCIIKKGLTADLVCQLARDVGAEILVTGATGAGVIERTLIGSTTTAFINHAEIPVLIIPGESNFNGLAKLVYTSDLKESNISEVSQILPLVKHFDAELDILFIDNTIHADSEEFSEIMKTRVHDSIDHDKLAGFICTDPNVINGINLFLKENPADMICMLTHGRKFPATLWSASVTKKFSYHPDIPLLVIHKK